MQIDTTLPLCPEDEKLQMRKWVITSVLESEKTYLGILDILMQVCHVTSIWYAFCKSLHIQYLCLTGPFSKITPG